MVDVVITIVICGTILLAVRIAVNMMVQRFYDKSSLHRDRVGSYKHLLAAFSSLEQNPEEDKAWHRLGSAINHVSLVAPPDVMNEVDRANNLVRQSCGYLSPDEAQALIKVLREDIDVALDASTDLQFQLVPSGSPTKNATSSRNESDTEDGNV